MSEFTILDAGFRQGDAWFAGTTVALIALIFVGILFALTKMVFGKAKQTLKPGEISATCLLAMGLNLLLVIGLGVFLPTPLSALLKQAVTILGGGH